MCKDAAKKQKTLLLDRSKYLFLYFCILKGFEKANSYPNLLSMN